MECINNLCFSRDASRPAVAIKFNVIGQWSMTTGKSNGVVIRLTSAGAKWMAVYQVATTILIPFPSEFNGAGQQGVGKTSTGAVLVFDSESAKRWKQPAVSLARPTDSGFNQLSYCGECVVNN